MRTYQQQEYAQTLKLILSIIIKYVANMDMFLWAGNCCMLLKKYDLALKFFMYVYQKPNL